MAATQDTIRKWLIQAKQDNATHLIVVCDTYDWSDYPIGVKPDQKVEEVLALIQNKEMQKVMEVYDLSLNIESQLNEERSWHVETQIQDSIWRDESTGLPIHMHGHPIKVSEISSDTAQMGNPVACNCGNSFWDISKSAGELVKKHEKGQIDD
jgi:hypothetical protein